MVDVNDIKNRLNVLKSEAGQLSVGNIIGLLIAIVVFAVVLPTMTNFINMAKSSTDATTDTILSAIVPLMAVGLVWMVFTYSRPTYQRRA